MIVFMSDQASGNFQVLDMYSTEKGEPALVTDIDLYFTSNCVNRSDLKAVECTVVRSYDSGLDTDFIVQLDTIVEMGFAIRDQNLQLIDTSDTAVPQITFGAHTRHGFFNMVIHSV